MEYKMIEYLKENVDIKNLIIYFIAINIIGFIAMGWDKWKAQRQIDLLAKNLEYLEAKYIGKEVKE